MSGAERVNEDEPVKKGEPAADAEPVSEKAPKQPITVTSLVVAALFGLAFAYFVYSAIGNLIELPKSYSAIGLPGESVPWALLVIGLLVPVAVYVLAFIVCLRRRVLDKVVIFVMALAVTAGLGYTIIAIHRLTFAALIATLGS